MNNSSGFERNGQEKLHSAADDLVDKATSAVDQAKDKAAQVANDALERGRAAGQKIEAVAGNMKGAIDKSLSDQPMTTLAAAAVVGFVLGALWKS